MNKKWHLYALEEPETDGVTSLLLEMGEVGKLFCSPSSKEEDDDDEEEGYRPVMHRRKQQRAHGDRSEEHTSELQSH